MKNFKHALAALALLTGGSAFADTIGTLLTLEQLSAGVPHLQAGSPQPGACDWAAAKSACTNMTDTYTLQGCSVAKGKIILLGGFDEAFSGTGADLCTNPLVNGETATRTSKGLSATFASGESLAFDTAGGTAYDGTVIPATGIVSALANDITSTSINGAHTIFKDKDGVAKEDDFAMSTAPVLMSGVMADGTFAITEGKLRVFHQIDKYNSDVTIDKLSWSDKACCHPVSGKLSEVQSGAKTGNRSLTFTAKCGTATLVDVDGSSSEVNLPACQ
jgi:hypothetical protein